MFSDFTRGRIPEWNARKLAQWKRIEPIVGKDAAGNVTYDGVLGLQMVRSGQSKTKWMLTCSTDTFYESIILGQLPQIVMEPSSRVNPGRKREVLENDRKPYEMRQVDLSDDEVDQVLDRWKYEESVQGLRFVGRVWVRGGKIKAA